MGRLLQKRRQTLERVDCEPLKGSKSELVCNVSDLPANTSGCLQSECASVQAHRSKKVSGAKCGGSLHMAKSSYFLIVRRNRHWREQVWLRKSPPINLEQELMKSPNGFMVKLQVLDVPCQCISRITRSIQESRSGSTSFGPEVVISHLSFTPGCPDWTAGSWISKTFPSNVEKSR